MAKYDLKFIRSEEIADRTMAFYFEKPEGLEFKAGASGDFSIQKDLVIPDDRGNMRPFSIITTNADSELGFATRMSGSGFKETLKTLTPGDIQVVFDGPWEDFNLHKNENKKAIFIQGGIGVTPVISMIKDAINRGLGHQMILFHANSSLENAPFQKEFEELASKNDNFTFVQILSHGEGDAKNVEHGRMSVEIFNKYVSVNDNNIYYLSGPEGMVKSMRSMLVDDLGADEDDIRTEEFPGY